MSIQAKREAFWCNDRDEILVVVPLNVGIEGAEVVVGGVRFRWTRGELGALYRKCISPLGQVGGELAPTYTVQEYQALMEKRAREHEALLPPGLRASLRPYLLAAQFEPPAPRPEPSGPESTAIFLR